MRKVISVIPLPDYKLHLVFDNGVQKVVDIQPFIRGGVSEALKAREFFDHVAIESGGGIFWPNGYDFCPNFLYEEVPAIDLTPA